MRPSAAFTHTAAYKAPSQAQHRDRPKAEIDRIHREGPRSDKPALSIESKIPQHRWPSCNPLSGFVGVSTGDGMSDQIEERCQRAGAF